MDFCNIVFVIFRVFVIIVKVGLIFKVLGINLLFIIKIFWWLCK